MSLVALLCLFEAVKVTAVTCNQNNCYRAVLRAESGAADCSSYLAATVTPRPITVTTTTTIVTTRTVITKAKREAEFDAPFLYARATSKPVPTYASACTSSGAYSSACSCLGYSPAPVNLAPSTAATKTVTVKSTTTAVVTCATSEAVCNKTCVNLSFDNNNCGACGNTCGSGQYNTCCSGKCVDKYFDANNCGSCGRVCQGLPCKNGGCNCPYDRPTNCFSYCIDATSDRNNCGGCGKACATGQNCFDGTCCATEGSSPLQAYCDGKCIDTSSDVNNCGGCGYSCGSDQSCTFANCCDAGEKSCEPGGDCIPNDQSCA